MDNRASDPDRPIINLTTQAENDAQTGIIRLCESIIELAMQNKLQRLVTITMEPNGNIQFNCVGHMCPIDSLGMMEMAKAILLRKLT